LGRSHGGSNDSLIRKVIAEENPLKEGDDLLEDHD